jgi:hypothetical protein
MSGYFDFWLPIFGLFTERLARTGAGDLVERAGVPERRIFMARARKCKETGNYTNLNERGSTRVVTSCTGYKSRRPSIDFSNVTSSANSISIPTGIPYAIRETRTPNGLSNRVR